MKRHSVTFLLLLMLIGVSISLSGCVLVPFVQAFKETGVTAGDRKALLGQEVKKFTDAIMWGSKSEALSIVAEESREEIARELGGLSEEERIVDSKVDEITWGDDAYTATVKLKVRFYKVPFYVVKNRVEEQQWNFSVGTGWRLTSRTVLEG
jgi:hypothetical protein